MIDVENLKHFKEQNPDVPVVCYVNSTAEIKALCDVCCTSSNAVNIVKNLGVNKVLFVPDTYLGKYVETKLNNNGYKIEVITYNGFCPTHLRIRPEDMIKAKKDYPDALILAHPECHKEVTKLADFVGSTKEIMEYAIKSNNKQFIIATELGVKERLQRDSDKNSWGKEFILINPNIVCPNMKRNTLENIYQTLLNESNEITIDKEIIESARKCIDKMFELNSLMTV